MKIRIKGPSVRIRLTKTEVHTLVHKGYLEDYTPFPVNAFVYALQRTPTGDALTATFEHNKMTLFIPQPMIANWDTDAVITHENDMALNETENLHLMLEKDFVCLDNTDEDQSDNYANPNEIC